MDISDNFYAAWQPVRVNVGNGVSKYIASANPLS
jgi:hypothetical protein